MHTASHQPQLCVGELGFGTGLNFVVLAEALLTQTSARLRFISCEKHPLCQADWDRLARDRGADLPLYHALADHPPPLLGGWHERHLAGGRVVLQVYHGEVGEALLDLAERQQNPVDAWFLDGFAPAKNPDMWQPMLYRCMAELSHEDTTIATFTAAGHVRRGLQAAGFAMRRIDQQPFKRESLAGIYRGRVRRHRTAIGPSACVHGAGLAGALSARQLAEAGCTVRVFDPHGVASGASLMPVTVAHSRLLGDGSLQADFRCCAFDFATAYLGRFQGFRRSGALWIQGPNLNQAKLSRISRVYDAQNPEQHNWITHLSAAEATACSGIESPGEALLHPRAGTVNLALLCRELLEHPAIEVHQAAPGLQEDSANIVCAASATRSFAGCEHLELTDVHGQLDAFECAGPPTRMPVVGNGYLVPAGEKCVMGATYEHTPWLPDEATAHNQRINAHLLDANTLRWHGRYRGARCVSSDRIPVAGTLDLEGGPQATWLLTGLGSMGTTAGPLGAAIISAMLLGWLPPTTADVISLLRPQRFAERQARRGIRHAPGLIPTEA